MSYEDGQEEETGGVKTESDFGTDDQGGISLGLRYPLHEWLFLGSPDPNQSGHFL